MRGWTAAHPRKVTPLEGQLHRHLHYARRVASVRGADLSEVDSIVRIGVWATKGGAIEGIVHFPAELHVIAFLKGNILEHAEIKRVDSRRLQDVAAGISERSYGIWLECCRVEIRKCSRHRRTRNSWVWRNSCDAVRAI